jgi:hypothetical protein
MTSTGAAAWGEEEASPARINTCSIINATWRGKIELKG